ncbi:putative ribonuclease H-like domain-containing protein [Tanacetum coccineum]|uniref:Ribonuclease H-like domain-containing protein n=1 Tax=Tanacetum coccineum TaxID=301880 RepID=A0ABQ4YKN0_9ASTR
MKAVKDKDALQKNFDSWSASSKNLWKLIDCGMSSTVKIGLGYGIKSNAEVLGYEEEISRGIFAFRETDAGNYDIPLYNRFKQVEYKGVPHPLSGDYTPREQEDIDDSLYEYGKYGPQPQSPSPTESDASSTVYSTCQSNDSDGEQGTVSDHSVNDDPIPILPIEQVTICHRKRPTTGLNLNKQLTLVNWNQGMQRDLGTGYSFERKPCFVCGSLSHLIKDCDYYEKKMAREAAFKSTRVVHANVRQATPAWTNSNRVNKANQFTPRPVQLNNIRPNLSTASKTIKTGRVNVNTGHGNVSSVSSAGTQIKSGASRFNTGKQHVNSGSVHVNSGTQFKSGASRFNTGKQHVSSGRVNRPVSNNTSPKPSQVNLNSPKKCFSKQRSLVNRPFSRNTAHKSNIYAVKGKMGTAVKTSAGCVWRKAIPLSNTNSGPTPDSNVNVSRGPQGRPKPVKAWIIKTVQSGSVTIGGSKGSIIGKWGTIRLGNLVFDDVAFVKELGHFNLFSISQICDKKLNVLFTEKECFVVSSDFKMPDANQVLLKVPRQHNMYTFDMKNVASSKGYTCLLAKASSDEAKLWHRRLGHLNFKNLNKLVNNNLVRGLPSKSFKNDHTCVACQKESNNKPLSLVMQGLLSKMGLLKKEIDPIEAARTMLATHTYLLNFLAEAVNTVAILHSADCGKLQTDGPVPETAPTSTNPVNTGSINLNTAFEEVNSGNIKLSLLMRLKALLKKALRLMLKMSSQYKHTKEAIIKLNNIVFLLAFYLNLIPMIVLKAIEDGKLFEAMQEELLHDQASTKMGLGLITQCAFLYGTIDEEVYVSQPPGFVTPDHPTKVYKVVKALYGLHQAPRAWYATLSTFLEQHGYKRGTIDKTLFIRRNKKDIMLISNELLMVTLTFFLKVYKSSKQGRHLHISDKYVAEILKKFDLVNVKTAITPMETKLPLTKDEEAFDVDLTPKTSHLNAVKRIFKYLKGKPNLGLWYPRESPFDLEAFSDSDYGGSNLDRKSTTGGCQFLGQRLISWQCKKQTIVATSTTEAEYVAAANCCGQVLWVQNQLLDYGFNFMNTKIHIDNESTICIVKNPVYHSKTKHIEIRHHFIRDCYEKKLISVEKIHTDLNVADLLTKPFDGPWFNYLVVSIGMINP